MVTSISSTTDSSSTTKSAYSGLKAEDFVAIMLNELQNQDPTEPVDSSTLVDQMSQIYSIQGDIELSDTLKDLSLNQKLSAAGTMLGKNITGLDDDGDQINGIVTSVQREDDDIYLELDSGEKLNVNNVTDIVDTSAETAEAQSADGIAVTAQESNDSLLEKIIDAVIKPKDQTT